MTSDPRTVAYIDGSQMLYRAEFGFPSRIINRSDCDVTGLFGFLALTRKALTGSPLSPTHAVIVFDADAPTTRSRIDPRYRAMRQQLPAESADNPFRHLPWIKRSLQVWGMPYVEDESAEADDVISALVDRDGTARHHAIVISRDKDFHQLVDAHVSQWDSARGREKGWITPEAILERYRIGPSQWCDYIGLVGDPADGMPGVRGIGPVRAERMLRGGRSLDDITDELTPPERLDALRQRDLHRLNARIQIPPTEPSLLPAEGLPRAAAVLDALGLWDSPYP